MYYTFCRWGIWEWLTGWFLLRASHEVVVKMLAAAGVIRGFKWGRRTCLQGGSLLAGSLGFLPHGPLCRLWECPHDMATRFPGASHREGKEAVMVTVSGATHCYFLLMLFVRGGSLSPACTKGEGMRLHLSKREYLKTCEHI